MASLHQAITVASTVSSAIPLHGQERKWFKMEQLFKEMHSSKITTKHN